MTMHEMINTKGDLGRALAEVETTGDSLVLRNLLSGSVATIGYDHKSGGFTVSHPGSWEPDWEFEDNGRLIEVSEFRACAYVDPEPLLPEGFLPALVLWWPGSIATPAGVTE